MSDPVKECPRCKTLRPFDESFCQGEYQGTQCRFRLVEIPIRIPKSVSVSSNQQTAVVDAQVPSTATSTKRACLNGHPLGDGDFLCSSCGEGPRSDTTQKTDVHPSTGRKIGNWSILAELDIAGGEADLFRVSHDANGNGSQQRILKLYRRGIEPQTDLYPALQKVDPDFCARLFDYGRHEGRAFEVWEYMTCGSLAQLSPKQKSIPNFVREAVKEIAMAIQGLAALGVHHRDLKPANILIRAVEPLDLVLGDFGTAVLGEFDLKLTVARQTTRYTAPEAIVGTFAPSSDWWSLGVIILEMLTEGKTFESVHERAFLLHLVTKGVQVPEELPDEWKELLKGLLTKDHCKRWGWEQLHKWLNGERGIPNYYKAENDETGGLRRLKLGTKEFSTIRSFAVEAAEPATWNEAIELLQRGTIASWLEETKVSDGLLREIRNITADPNLDWDGRLSLSLLVLNSDLPLCHKGEVVDPPWLLRNIEIGHAWANSSLPRHLNRLNHSTWLVKLRERSDRVRTRVKNSQIPVDNQKLNALLLVTLPTQLESKWTERRKLFPEPGISSVAPFYERKVPSEEDLIILLAISPEALKPLDALLQECDALATTVGMAPLTREAVESFLEFTRGELFEQLNLRAGNFSSCGRTTLDEWAETFRLERRLPLSKVLLLLSIPPEEWRQPPQQDYVRNILNFFEKQLLSSMQRGPLMRLLIASKQSKNIDLTELGSSTLSASALLEHILQRKPDLRNLDPGIFQQDPALERRVKRLRDAAQMYVKETGIDGLYLGFPFLVLRQSAETVPRIAPLFLIPVKLFVPTGQRSLVQIGFDKGREEVRINPALHVLLPQGAAAIEEIRNDLFGRNNCDIGDVMEAFSHVCKVASRKLGKLPPGSVSIQYGDCRVECAAVLFLSDFSGQTIAEDLRAMANRSTVNTSLEVLIRAATPPIEEAPSYVPERDRYFTAEADPSQTRAVFQARVKPGLVVQGPPGTGKSQTIVNTICDCLGRKERVLVVCQKPAALEVVEKRLKAEGLGHRFFYLKDPAGDRTATLKSLREQIENLRNQDVNVYAVTQARRTTVAERVEALEKQLNDHHSALHGVDGVSGSPFKEILSELLNIEKGSGIPKAAPRLRNQLESMSMAEVESIIGELECIAQAWLHSNWERSPFSDLNAFYPDQDQLHSFWQDFRSFYESEKERTQKRDQTRRFIQTQDPTNFKKWIEENGRKVTSLSQGLAERVQSWGSLFRNKESAGHGLLQQLKNVQKKLLQLNGSDHHDKWSKLLLAEKNDSLETLLKCSRTAEKPPIGLAVLSLGRFLRQQGAFGYLKKHCVGRTREQAGILAKACGLELELRPLRATFASIHKQLGIPDEFNSLPDLIKKTETTATELASVKDFIELLFSCPASEPEFDALISKKDAFFYQVWVEDSHHTIEFFEASFRSLSQLEKLSQWYRGGWCERWRQTIQNSECDLFSLEKVLLNEESLEPYQKFRSQASTIRERTMNLLGVLRDYEKEWKTISPGMLANEITRTIRREALLGWKERYEREHPVLTISLEEFQRKRESLLEADQEIRRLNRKFLEGISPGSMAPRAAWEDVTMLTGPRAKRLRQLVEHGDGLGLFHLRPVWLVNPDMVSRLFPLKPGFFDVVIFDEASQIPVEVALPALFRAKRVIISGDEKQMPPSNFFQSRLENDEDEEGNDASYEDAAELTVSTGGITPQQNKRAVKDCDDLLELAQTTLPSVTLQIHYRSQYRELIDFSNAAFYSGKLSIPVQHAESEIRSKKPIEVIRVDTPYASQTNQGEAEKIIQYLAELWSTRPFQTRPSIGIVSFNLKQAELILEKLEARAQTDVEFRKNLEMEYQRQNAGEDISLFVKNLENVQGDERDWIIFSTTFGRDKSGKFLRAFGVLNPEGGEKRLNVAVTRAKEKVVLVTSMPINEVSNFVNGHRAPNKPRDYLQAYLDYADKISRGELTSARVGLKALSLSTNTTSEFCDNPEGLAAVIVKILSQEGIKCVPLKTGDAFAIDLAVVHPITNNYCLGIECDSPCHGLLNEARGRELWRTRMLNSSLTGIHRVWTRAFYHDSQRETQRLLEIVRKAIQN